MKYKYSIKGMSCSACSASVERVVKKLDGITSASVSLTQELLTVESEQDLTKNIIEAVKKAGFKAYPFKLQEETKTPNKEKIKLALSVSLLVILMYVAMHDMFNLPFFTLISKKGNAILFVLTQLILTVAVIGINHKFFIKGTTALLHGSPNMDTLVSLGSGTAFIYGVYTFITICIFTANGNQEVTKLLNNLYLESSAMILTFVSVGKYLESLAKSKTESATKKLKKLSPKTAIVLIDGNEKEIDITSLKVNDIVILKEGSTAPCDGIIINGKCEINESNLTGESMPVLKEVDSQVKASTLCVSGYAQIKVTAVNEDTEISKIIDYILSTEASKAPVQRLADKISGIFVPTVIAISVITFIVWFIISKQVSVSISYAISVLVVSCPCALGLATPVAVTVATGRCAKYGILIKNAEVLEKVSLVKTAFFDKTGTLTEGKPIISSVYGLNNEELLEIASIEAMSSHPLSTAVTNFVKSNNLFKVEDFKSETGKGVLGKVNGNQYIIGNHLAVENLPIKADLKNIALNALENGKTVLYVSKNNQVIGFLEAFDEIKKSSFNAISSFKDIGIKTVIISGDNNKVVNLVKQKLGVDEAYGEISPKDKAEIVKKHNQTSNTMFIGDGVNDSPALIASSIGVSVANGTDIALSASEIILLNSNVENAVNAVKIGKKTRRIIKQNLFWAFIYNLIGIPIAFGAFSSIGIVLSPMIASALMSVSSIFVVTNALRLQKL